MPGPGPDETLTGLSAVLRAPGLARESAPRRSLKKGEIGQRLIFHCAVGQHVHIVVVA
jgi:hypothetical protein